MKRFALAALLALTVLPIVAAEDLTGKWSGSFTGTHPMSGREITEAILLNLVHKGAELTGTAGPNEKVQEKIQNGKVEGDKIYFELHGPRDAEGGPVMKFTLSYEKGQLKGDVSLERGQFKSVAKFDATRVK